MIRVLYCYVNDMGIYNIINFESNDLAVASDLLLINAVQMF